MDVRPGGGIRRDEEANMSDGQRKEFPTNWRIGQDFDPNQHLMQLKGRDYLNVQSRLLWFIRDQRALIVAGLATCPYVVRTELVEMDREHGWAHFRTHVRDVIGNEATMYGSEAAKDFPDYAEKASTKSLGRALLALGYGTAFAPEMDEGDRVVDSPVDRRGRPPSQSNGARPLSQQSPVREVSATYAVTTTEETAATEKQMASIRKLCEALGRPEPPAAVSYLRAKEIITQLSAEYQRTRRAS
jgi:hypothetical protein